jgi:hypothetical protein
MSILLSSAGVFELPCPSFASRSVRVYNLSLTTFNADSDQEHVLDV